MVTGTISKLIIRPGRSQYVLAELGPPEFDFGRNKRRIRRVDFQVKNARGLQIEVSVFEPVQRVQDAKDGEIPAIIYLHGNIGSRRDALQNIDFVLSYDIYYVCFDFTGSGLSEEGKYISLGYYEQEDTHCVIQHLKENYPKLGKIGLWGRSMGAATAVLYAGQHSECVDLLILDSPFSSLYQVASELIEHRAHIPKFLAPNVAKISLQLLRDKIIKKAEFDIKRVSPVDVVHNCKMPALFVSAHKDDIVAATHSKQLCEQYSGEHKLIMVEGDHNTFRTSTFFNEASAIIFNYLLPDEQKAALGEPISVFGKSLPKQDCKCFLLQWVPPLPDQEKKQLNLLDKREEIVKEHHKDKKGKTKGKGKEKEKEKEKVKGKKKQVLAYPRQMVLGICASGLLIIQLPYSETVVTSFPLIALRSYSLLEDNMWFALQMKDDYEDVSHLADSKRVIVFNGVEAEAASKTLGEQLEALLWQQSGLENGGQGGDNSDIIEKIENCVFKLMESKDKLKEKKLVEVIKEVLTPVISQRNMDSKEFSTLVETTVHKAMQEYKQKQKS